MSGISPSGYLEVFARVLARIEITTRDVASVSLDEGVSRAVEIVASLKGGRGKVLLIGNGGSAAIASHMQNDLCKAVGVRAMVFNEAPLLMALANDDGYDTVFYQPVGLWADAGDLLIAISSSGESENVVKAATLAAEKRCRVLTFTGFKPTNRLRQLGDVNIYVPASDYGCVEMAHSVVGHCITDLAIKRQRGQ